MSPRPKIYAVLYARFSPRSKAELCPSCDVQLADMRRFCEARGYTIAAEFRDDAISGKSAERRPGFQGALRACRRGYVLLMRDFKRFSRNAGQTLDFAFRLARRGVSLETLDEGGFTPGDPNSFLVFGMRAIMAQYERMSTSKKTAEKVRRYQNVDRRRMSHILPYGFAEDPADSKRLVESPDEQAAIARILTLRDDGLTLRGIADQLTGEGLTCRGKPWKFATIRNILKRERLKTAS
jgi:DNA invertase Pin-like site-specific DNA recombinase